SGTIETADSDANGETNATGDSGTTGDSGATGETTGETKDDEAEDKVEETAAVEMVDIEIESDPAGAIVKEGNKLLGVTPLTASFEAGSGKHDIEITAHGLLPATVEIDTEKPKPVS